MIKKVPERMVEMVLPHLNQLSPHSRDTSKSLEDNSDKQLID